jgi:hypothetical protein
MEPLFTFPDIFTALGAFFLALGITAAIVEWFTGN